MKWRMVINKNKPANTERARKGVVSEERWGGGGLGKALEREWEMGLPFVECLLTAAHGGRDGPLKPWNSPLRMILFGTEWSWGSQSMNVWAALVRDHMTRKDQNGVEPKCEWFQSPCSYDSKYLLSPEDLSTTLYTLTHLISFSPRWNPVQQALLTLLHRWGKQVQRERLTWPKFHPSSEGEDSNAVCFPGTWRGAWQPSGTVMGGAGRTGARGAPSRFPALVPGGRSMCEARIEGLLAFSFSQRTFPPSHDPYQSADSINFLSWLLPTQLFPGELHSPNFQATIQNSKCPVREGALQTDLLLGG